MANMMTDKTHLQKEHRKYKTLSLCFLLLTGVFWLIHVPLMMPYITMPGMLISFLVSGSMGNKAHMIGKGLEGEEHTANLLSQLPSDTYVFSDLKVKADGRESEMDSVIVSTRGVFIVETKNHNGEIVGNAEDKYWAQHKIGRKGTPYQNQIYSPIKQVGMHVYRLSQFFKENGLNVWVDGVAFFSNHETSVRVKNIGKTPVFSHYESDDLLDYVTTKKKKGLSEQEVQRIVELLKQIKSA